MARDINGYNDTFRAFVNFADRAKGGGAMAGGSLADDVNRHSNSHRKVKTNQL